MKMEFDMAIAGKCILSAEDNEINQIVLESVLSEQSLPFQIVHNGKQAVEAWRELQPRIILMDISMPILNGYEAMKIIRAEEAGTGNHVPIVALTAHALKGDDQKCFEAGADHYLTKPVNPDLLLEKISEILDDGRPDYLTVVA